ncbi:MAG TPA: hypothetical protein VLW55_21570 [Burkholderiaceae bacterium]|nr:hypothetical protein [Burkholderiaceae bacterium]
MSRGWLSCAVAGLLACPLSAGAVLIDYGTAEAISFRSCIAGRRSATQARGCVS